MDHDTPTQALPKRYALRMQEVLDFLAANLDEDLRLEHLAEIANFSAFHFHRQFSAYTGITIAKYIRLLRLKRASMRLAFVPDFSVLDIALEAGYETSEGFSRAFKALHGQSPLEFRSAPSWQQWQRSTPIMTQTEDEPMSFNVEIVDFPETPVAAVEYKGPQQQELKAAWQLIAWRRENNVPPGFGCTYGVHFSDPNTTPDDEYRFDVCVSYDKEIGENPHGVVAKAIPAGRCARARHFGSREHIPLVERLYREWLPESGEELRDYPVYFHYVNVGPDVQEKDMVTDIYLPIV